MVGEYSKIPYGTLQGNQNGLKLKDPIVRWEAYMDLCDWLAQGKSQESFVFKKHGVRCTCETILKYLKDESEFEAIHKQCAHAEGYSLWEDVCAQSAKGKNEKANTASLQMIMRNKYGWDKKVEEHDDSPKDELSRLKDEKYKLLHKIQILEEKLNASKCQASQVVHRSDTSVQPVDRGSVVGEDIRIT